MLTVSSSLRHKNLDRLLEAFAALARNGDARLLVVVGHAGLDQDALRDAGRSARASADRVVFTGWIDDADLEGFYAAASVFVYPSLMEGFGMPVLEAMRREVPVACSNVSALPEVAGDAAELSTPTTSASIAAARARGCCESPERRAELVARGREQLPPVHAGSDTARETLAVYREGAR